MSMITLLFACAPVSLTVGGDDTSDDTGNSGDDTGIVEAHPAAGSYTDGELGYIAAAWEWDICSTDEIDITVGDDGSLSGTSDCLYEGSSDDYDFEINLSGTIDEDGEVEGTVTYPMWINGNDWELADLDADLTGEAEDGSLSLSWEGVAEQEDYDDLEITGWIDVDRDE